LKLQNGDLKFKVAAQHFINRSREATSNFKIPNLQFAISKHSFAYFRAYSLSPSAVGFIAFAPFFQFAGQTSPCSSE